MTTSAARLPGLDGLRAVAVLLVLGVHAWKSRVPGGYIGVDLFFVLSGFLITTLLLREHATRGYVSVRRFYARRALRLFPALAVVLAVAMVFSLTLLAPQVGAQTRTGTLWSLAYAANWARALDPGQNNGALGHTWSLSIEEQFYVLWPLILLLLLRRGSIRLALCLCATLVAVIWLWRLNLEPMPGFQERVYFGFDTRADLLLIGCAIALGLALGWLHRIPALLLQLSACAGVAYALVFAALAPPAPVFGSWNDYIPETVMIGALVCGLIVAQPAWLLRPLQWRPVVALGTISYGVYLWHYVIWTALTAHLSSGPVALIVLIALTLGAAVASYACIERPALKLKQRLGGQPSVLGAHMPVTESAENPSVAAAA